MFDLFRSREKSVRILLGALLVVVALSMLVYLIPGGPGGPSVSGQNTVAAVGGEKITMQDVQRAIQRVTRGQSNLPKGLLAMYIPSIVNQLIEAKAMAYKAREMGLRISDQELGDSIQAQFAAGLGTKFDMNIYRAVLAQQGMTIPDFENQEREAMLGMRLENIELQSLVVSDQDARAEYQRKNLKIGLQYIDFDEKNFASKVNQSPAAIKAYFDKNRSLFRIPEKRDVELIAGSTADFMQSAQVSDAQLKQQYQDNIDQYRIPERVKVRHILIKTQGKPKSEVPKLKAKAEDILNQLKHGADFAKLAKEDSEDPGSADKGGELGWIVRGQTVPNFEKTAFSLQPGQLSGLVETEYGYHIIQVEQREAAHVQSFDDVKSQILANMKKQIATDDLNKAMDAAHSAVVHTPGQAADIAKKYHLKFFKVDDFAQGGTLPAVNSQPEVANAIFATSKGGVTDVVNLEKQAEAAFAVVTNVVPAHNAQYAEVAKEVQQKYTSTEASRLAEEAAKTAAERARKGESLEAIAKQYGLPVKTAAPFTIDGAAEGIGAGTMFANAFKSNVGAIIGPVGAETGQFVCRVSQKIPADMSQFEKNKDSVIQSLTAERRSVQQSLFRDSVVTDLKRRGKIKLNQDNINRIVSQYQS